MTILRHTMILTFFLPAIFFSIGAGKSSGVDLLSSGRWKYKTGLWLRNTNGISQTDTSEWNTNAYCEVRQTGVMVYEWDVTLLDGILDAGMHIFASRGNLSERGNSYLIWKYRDGFVIYKSMNNRLMEKIRFSADTRKGTAYRCSVRYDSLKGKIEIMQAGEFIGAWVDPDPLRKGGFISLRTNKTKAVFSRVIVYPDR